MIRFIKVPDPIRERECLRQAGSGLLRSHANELLGDYVLQQIGLGTLTA
jgi:hypothetical protein